MAVKMQVKNKRFAYPKLTGEVVLSAPSSMQLLPTSIIMTNGYAGSSNLGLGISYAPSSQGTLIELAAAPGTATAYVPNDAFLSNLGDRVYFQAKDHFDFMAFLNSTPATGAGTLSYEYWNGTAWTALTPHTAPDLTQAQSALIFASPLDWAKGAGGILGLDDSFYSIRMTLTGTFVVAPSSNSILVCALCGLRLAVGPNEFVSFTFEEDQYLLNAQEALVPYFQYAHQHNVVEVSYKFSP